MERAGWNFTEIVFCMRSGNQPCEEQGWEQRWEEYLYFTAVTWQHARLFSGARVILGIGAEPTRDRRESSVQLCVEELTLEG